MLPPLFLYMPVKVREPDLAIFYRRADNKKSTRAYKLRGKCGLCVNSIALFISCADDSGNDRHVLCTTDFASREAHCPLL